MTSATLSSKGQITIPLKVRQKLGVAGGDRVEFIEIADGEFVLVPATGNVRALKGIVPKPPEPYSVKDMRRIITRRRSG